MRILLVEPRTPDTFWSFRHALPFIGKRASNPPLGLLTMAGLLPPDWDLRLVDMNARTLRTEDIRWADTVMVSAMLAQRDSLVEVIRRCRQAGKPVIGGGPLFSADPADNLGVDHVVTGEAEELAAALVQDMRDGRVLPLYQAARFPDLALTPLPRWDLIDLRDYATMSVQSCRGCPFDCEFCDVVALNGHRPRYKSPARFREELEALRSQGWSGPTFLVDDNFVGDPRRCKEILRAIIAWRGETSSRMTFLTEASVNMAEDPELLRLMVQAGFKKVFLGIETPSAESLKGCHKIQNLRCDLSAAVRRIQRAGLEVMGGFIVGFDSDRADIFQRQFEFIQRTGVVTAMVGMLQAIPRSRLYQRLALEGRLRGDCSGDNTRAAFNFEPKLDRDFLVENYRSLMRRLYEPDTYYRRVLVFLKNHKPSGPRGRVSGRDLLALPRSLWLMGIRERGRRAYWRYLSMTLIRHPDRIGLAITLAITGRHFRIVAETL